MPDVALKVEVQEDLIDCALHIAEANPDLDSRKFSVLGLAPIQQFNIGKRLIEHTTSLCISLAKSVMAPAWLGRGF